MISLGSERWTSASPNITVSFAYEKQRSGADMQYRVQVTVAALGSGSYFGYPIYLKLSMAGVHRETSTLKDVNPSRWSSAITYTSPWYTIPGKTTGTTPVSFTVYSGLGSSRTATYSYNMEVDPGATSEISVSNGTLGTPLTLTLTRYDSSFTHNIEYTCGSVVGSVVSGSMETSVTWDTSNGNQVYLAEQNPSGSFVEVIFTVSTYSGSMLLGTNTAKAVMVIPDTVKPSVSLSISDAAGYPDIYGAYVQGCSKLLIIAMPTLAYGSPITKYEITADGASYSTSRVATAALRGKGSLTVTAKVTDARGRTSDVVSQPIRVLEYAKPVVNVSAYRCNSDGTMDPEGANMKIEVTSEISSLDGKNSATYTVVHSGGEVTGTGTNYTSGVLRCDVSYTHNVTVTVTDKLSSTTKNVVVPIAYTLLDYHRSGRGIAFGKVATRDGFDCAMPAHFTGGLSVGDKSLLDLIYPVGSIYMSANNVSPQTFFGGTWDRVKDRFLLAAGDTYAAGGTGGSATNTHYHFQTSGSDGQVTYATKTFEAPDTRVVAGVPGTSFTTKDGYGDSVQLREDATYNQTVDIMPPYLTVYMWKRTA